MSARSEALATKVEAANNALLETTQGCTDAQWSAVCADGEWTQGFAAFHAGTSIGFISGMVQSLANGEQIPPITMDQINESNAQQNKDNAAATKAQALDLIKTNSPAAAQIVRGLSDEQLDRKATLLTGMPEFSVEQVIEMLLIGHPAAHTESIRKAQ